MDTGSLSNITYKVRLYRDKIQICEIWNYKVSRKKCTGKPLAMRIVKESLKKLSTNPKAKTDELDYIKIRDFCLVIDTMGQH